MSNRPSLFAILCRAAPVCLFALTAQAQTSGTPVPQAQTAPAPPIKPEIEIKPTIMDRIDQIIETFMGDPSAGVDIDMKHVLDTWRSMGPKPLNELSDADARRQPTPVEAAQKLMTENNKTLDPYNVSVTEATYPGPGGPMKVKLYMPLGPATPSPRPVVVFYHGGGFVMENADGSNVTARALAGSTGALVIAPSYRLAPEAKFPAAQDDALAAYRWVLANVSALGGDPKKIAIAGEGAGGLLSVDTCMGARDLKLPMPVAQILITPVAGIDMKTASYLQDAAARPWSEKAVIWAFGLFLTNPDEKTDPRIDLIGHGNLEGLPATTIITAEIDPLRSDGERLGGKLHRATVPLEMRDYPGVTHDFFGMGAAVEKASLAQNLAATRLLAAFAGQPAKEPELGDYD